MRVITVRMPDGLHSALLSEAASRGKSLNVLCVSALAKEAKVTCAIAGRPIGKLISHQGTSLPISQWADRLGVARMTLYSRLKRMSPEQAVSMPKQPGGRKRKQ